jgi:hypothetical protein
MAVRKHGVFAVDTPKSEALGDAPEDGENARDATDVEVVSVGGTSPIYFTVDGSTPTVRGDDTYVVQPGSSNRVPVRGAPPVTVTMVCHTADTYSVELFTS